MLVPVLIVRDFSESIDFLTRVLDFEFVFSSPTDKPFYGVLTRGGDELHLNLVPPGGRFGHASVIVICDAIDALFATFLSRGLSVPTRAHSAVHEGPLDQTWGTREFYVDDPSGNTIIFQQR